MKSNRTYDALMRRCIELARRGAEAVSPNPMVGSVIVNESGDILGEGWHQQFGGPHAEVHAIRSVEEQHGRDVLMSSTLVVNLEPCSHHGKTPPCADLIVDKNIRRVVVGIRDPNPQISGRGLDRLRKAGIEAIEGVLTEECARLNEPFLVHMRTGRPIVVLKVAQTLDGFVAARNGESRWISGEDSRRRVHELRSVLDGVLVGRGTATADDPQLTVRLAEGRQPWRIVLDRMGSLPAELRLFTDAWADKTIVLVGIGASPAYASALASRGGRIVEIEETRGHLDIGAILDTLGREDADRQPMLSVLVEAGPGLATALIRSGLVDRLHLFIAPKLLGDGARAFDGLGVSSLAEAVSFSETKWEQVGTDMLFTGYVRAAADLVGE